MLTFPQLCGKANTITDIQDFSTDNAYVVKYTRFLQFIDLKMLAEVLNRTELSSVKLAK